MKYILMNKHIELAKIDISDLGRIDTIEDIYNTEAFPVGVIVQNNDPFSKITRDYLDKWWHSRIIPASRDGLDYILAINNVETSSALSVKSLGLSLSDQYWIKPIKSDLSWNDVNFFTNEFSTDLGASFFIKGASSIPDISLRTPDASSNGWLKKKWTIINGKRYLAKAGSGTTFQEPYNETVASKIMDVIELPHVKYSVVMEKNRPLSLCENFITPDTEFVPAAFVSNVLPKENNEKYFSHLLKCANYLNIPQTQEYIDNLLTIDFLIENTDRHYGNFGFIRDVNTLKFIGPAPIFDNGTSLWSQVPGFEIGHWQLCKPFMETQQKQIALVKNFHLKIAGLEQCEEITRQTLLQNPFISKERIDKIANCVGNRVRVLTNHIKVNLRKNNDFIKAYDFFNRNTTNEADEKTSSIIKNMINWGIDDKKCYKIITANVKMNTSEKIKLKHLIYQNINHER